MVQGSRPAPGVLEAPETMNRGVKDIQLKQERRTNSPNKTCVLTKITRSHAVNQRTPAPERRGVAITTITTTT